MKISFYKKNCLTLLFLAFFSLNCDKSPTSTSDTTSGSINGIWSVIKYEETYMDYDAGFVVDSEHYVELVKDTIESIYLFNDGQCTIYNISRSYSDTGSGEYDYMSDICYDRQGVGFQVIRTMITGDSYWENQSITGVDWGNSTSDSCSEINTTNYEFKDDTLVIAYKMVISCKDNRSTTAIWKNYLLPYSGMIPPSNWPLPCGN